MYFRHSVDNIADFFEGGSFNYYQGLHFGPLSKVSKSIFGLDAECCPFKHRPHIVLFVQTVGQFSQ